jgi:hypothetical protein
MPDSEFQGEGYGLQFAVRLKCARHGSPLIIQTKGMAQNSEYQFMQCLPWIRTAAQHSS